MKITIDKKVFQLKFGFKCFLNLGKALGVNTFEEVIQNFGSFADLFDDVDDETSDDKNLKENQAKKKEKALTFEQVELVEQLVIAAVEAHPSYYSLDYSILDVSVLDTVFEKPELLGEILNNFVNSLPKEKGKPQPRTRARKKK